ncbi:MAG: hypothetical protein JHC84_14635 [Solirubrobacteraceae bacterium]|nr:hypothetical protein [Solirubrobacteraceae bacterium]
MTPRTFSLRRPAAALSLAGATLFVAGMALTPWESEDSTAAYHDALAAQPGRAQAAAITLAFAYALLAAGCFAFIGVLAGRRDWWLRIGAFFTVFGATLLPGLLITDAYDLALAQEVPEATGVKVSEAAGDLVLPGVLGLAGVLGLVLGTTLLAVALWRADLVPVAVPALVALSWVVGFATLTPVVLISGALLLVAAYAIAATRLWPVHPVGSAGTAAVGA